MMVNEATSYNVDFKGDRLLVKAGILFSGVTTSKEHANCASFKQHGKCLSCRACWSKDVKKINYLKH